MAGNKYLSNVGGFPTEILSVQSSTGATDAGKIIALNSAGTLDVSMLPTGIGPDTSTLTASEALAAGAWVNVYSNAGAFAVRNADASGGTAKMAHGFVLAAVASGAAATVYFEGANTQVTGMTPGNVWLTATPGVGSATAPTASGNIVQPLGTAVSATNINAEIGKQPIVLA